MPALIRSSRFAKATDAYSRIKFDDLRPAIIMLGFIAALLVSCLWSLSWSISPDRAPDMPGWHLAMGLMLALYPAALLRRMSPRALPWLLLTLLLATQAVFMFILTRSEYLTGSAGMLFWLIVAPILALIFNWRIRLGASLLLAAFPNLLAAVLGKFDSWHMLQFDLIAVPTMAITLFATQVADRWLRRMHDLEQHLAWREKAIDASGESLLVTNREGWIEYINPAFTQSSGYAAQEAIGNKPVLLKSGFHDSAYYENMWSTLLNGEVWRGEIINRHKDGSPIHLWSSIYPVSGRDGAIEKFVALSSDVTARKRLEEEVALGTAELEAIFNNAGVGIALLDLWGSFIKVNDFWLSMLAYSRDEIARLKLNDISHDDDVVENRQIYVALASGELPRHEDDLRFVRNGGRVFWGHLSMTPVKDETGYIRAIIAILQDINERKLLEGKLAAMAHFDALTGLPNRALFFDRLNQAVAQSKRSQGIFALMFVDLDGFKAVNDTFGHDTGDALLKAVAEQLQDCVRESDTVARMGGDEFTIILRALRGPDDAAAVAKKILSTLSAPYHLLDHECRIGASLGIVLYPQHGNSTETLLSRADDAMYAVKKAGKNAYRFAEDVTLPASTTTSQPG